MARGRPSKKQEILTTAQKLFSELGYQGASIDLVVKEAGVSKPTVYNNFPTKQALLHELLKQALTEAEQFRSAVVDNDEVTLSQGLFKAFQHIAQSPLHLAIYRICYGERHKLDETSCKVFSQYEASLARWCQQWLLQHKAPHDDSALLIFMGICREGILIPALAAENTVSLSTLEQAINQLLSQGNE